MPGKPSIERACLQCGATFWTWPVHVRKGNGKYCSRACASRSKPPAPLADRLWAKVDKTPGCWLWRGSRNALGYGQLNRGRRGEGLIPAHRAAYELMVGPIADGLEIDHLCRQPSCVRPDHLEPVTPAENKRRALLSPSNLNAAKAACINGHPFDEANTYVRKDGNRMCRSCHRDRQRNAARRKADGMKTVEGIRAEIESRRATALRIERKYPDGILPDPPANEIEALEDLILRAQVVLLLKQIDAVAEKLGG